MCVYICLCACSLCAFVHVYLSVQLSLRVCVEETACFCGSGNQPPAHSPNTCSPINMQCVGDDTLLLPSHCFLLLFSSLTHFLLFSAPSLLCSTGICTSPHFSLFMFPHTLTVHLRLHSLSLNSPASLLFPSCYHLLHQNPPFPLACLILL